MAMYKSIHAKPGTKTATEFAEELDQLATRWQFGKNLNTKERAKKDALIFDTASDEKLRQEALAKDFDYNALIKPSKTRFRPYGTQEPYHPW